MTDVILMVREVRKGFFKKVTLELRSERWVILSSKEPKEKHSRQRENHVQRSCGRRTNMDRAMRTSENTIYNGVGEGGKGITVHIKDFSFYAKSLVGEKKKENE